ncbi:MAG: hypothetical protein CMJ63_02765 [Planctomycetaceae bacterium]|nr:hypothetical protein [Planctomycetaceae bacterium]HCA39785.1 hypothetical protein [Phycisphaerales bacterium]
MAATRQHQLEQTAVFELYHGWRIPETQNGFGLRLEWIVVHRKPGRTIDLTGHHSPHHAELVGRRAITLMHRHQRRPGLQSHTRRPVIDGQRDSLRQLDWRSNLDWFHPHVLPWKRDAEAKLLIGWTNKQQEVCVSDGRREVCRQNTIVGLSLVVVRSGAADLHVGVAGRVVKHPAKPRFLAVTDFDAGH